MISVTNLWKSFGGQDIFRGASMRINPSERVAVVGPNGSGKTTLFEIITGGDGADNGEVVVPRGIAIGYLKQDTDQLRGRTVLEETISGKPALVEMAHRLHALEWELQAKYDPKLLAEYGDLRHRFEDGGGYEAEYEAKRILTGLGFSESDATRLTETFSGGWMMRIALAKLLLSRPDVLLLDEPTNHLDLASVEWLEKFLASYGGTVLFTSHDREFINGFAHKVVELRDLKLYEYSGDYDDFVAQRELALRQTAHAARQQELKVRASTEFIERFRYKKTKARQVQSRIKMLEKMERVEIDRPRRKAMKLLFPSPPRIGRKAMELAAVDFAYETTNVFEDLDLAIEGSWKAALVGPNGAGKTTLLKLIAGVLQPQSGERAPGHNAHVGYFAQHQIEALDPSKTVLEEMETVLPPGGDIRARNLLGGFLFSGDDVYKKVAVLSGGERTRLAMAKLLASPNNLLCLDEPTNHLDIQSRDVVGEALSDFPAAMVLITHDRNLIREVANRIIEVVAGRITVYDGDYDYFLEKRDSAPPPAAKSPPKDRPARSRASQIRQRQLRARLSALERELDEASREARELADRLADPAVYSKGDGIAELVAHYEDALRRTKELEAKWEALAERLDL